MSEKLILRMSSLKTSPIQWLVWSDQNNEVIVSGELQDQSELATLSRYAQGRQVTVLANSGDVRLLTHYLTMKPSRQILKALPFMLEEELAEDIDKLHFAIEETGFDKEKQQYFVNVAIVNKSTLANWLQLLADHNIQVRHVLPDVLCVPLFANDASNALSVLAISNDYLIREGVWQGSVIEKDWLNLYASQLQQKQAHLFTTAPQALLDAAANVEQQIELINEEPELPMLVLAKSALKQNWNLLQGEFAPKKPVSKVWQTWRPVVFLSAFLLVVQFFMMIAQWQQKEAELETAKAQLAEQYQQAFPREKLRINLLKRQLTAKVNAIKGGDSSTTTFGFIQLMDQLTEVFAAHRQVKVENLRFDGKRNELRLSAVAPSFQEFEKFRVDIVELGLSVNPGAVNNDGDSVTGSLSIREGQQ